MKKRKIIPIIIFLLILLIYVTNISAIPDSIILFKNEELNLGTVYGLTLDKEEYGNYEAIQASSKANEVQTAENVKVKVSLFNAIPVKTVNVSVIPETTVIPIGSTIGLKLYTNGVLVIGMTEIEGEKPYEKSGIKEGDMIVEINEETVTCTAELVQTVNKCNGNPVSVKYIREGQTCSTQMQPVRTGANTYKLGLWVRDAAAGVGTISYYEPSTGNFAALGHGIVDVDTDKLINIANGEIITTNILSIVKGEKGEPGQIRGNIINQTVLGQVSKNSEFGIYGKLTNASALNIDKSQELEIALRNEIKQGPAKIICSLENGVRKEYNVEIKKIYKNNNSDNKSMLIEVTDEELIEKTGGIIQGMSGSPIIQNNKFVGAVTHVLVNNPKQGYAVFGDIMIKQTREIN